MTNYLNLNTNYIQNGLGTLTYVVPTTGNYNVKCQSTFQPGSNLSIAVKDGATTLYTSPTVSDPSQTSMQFKFSFQATAADTITVVLSSSNAVDETLNCMQTNMSIGQGF